MEGPGDEGSNPSTSTNGPNGSRGIAWMPRDTAWRTGSEQHGLADG